MRDKMETISVPSQGDISKWGSGKEEQENRKEMFSVVLELPLLASKTEIRQRKPFQ